MDWFNAIRAARFHYLQVAFPGASDSDVSVPAVLLGWGLLGFFSPLTLIFSILLTSWKAWGVLHPSESSAITGLEWLCWDAEPVCSTCSQNPTLDPLLMHKHTRGAVGGTPALPRLQKPGVSSSKGVAVITKAKTKAGRMRAEGCQCPA